MPWPWFRTCRSHPEWNSRSSYPDDARFMDDRDFNSTRGLRNMSHRERDEVHRRAYGRLHDPYVTPSRRSRLNATMVYTANDTNRRDHRHRRRHTMVGDLADAGLNMVTRHTGCNSSGRNVRWHDEHMPEAPQLPGPWQSNSKYFASRYDPSGQYNTRGRTLRSSNTFQDNYVDAHQYIYGDRPNVSRRHTLNTLPTRSVGNSRYRTAYDTPYLQFGTGGSRNIDPSESRWRGWFCR